ncbi:glycosyltransferase [Acinetobacter variabilis]|uniref:glycosyltransferase n=1 Tax=Acinetobacter sp. YH1901141 TaxID=2601201 RepID=UPI0015D2226B|nr:glycosyltransferase [Acinetobacter sp. YH1901141]
MKDQKKILFIIDHLKGGGAEIMTLNLAKKLQERGYEINIITLININNYKEKTKSFNIQSIDFPTKFVGGKLLIDKKLESSKKEQLQSLIDEIKPEAVILTIWYAYLSISFINHPNIWIWSQADILPEFNKTSNPIKILRNIYKKRKFINKFKEVFSNKNFIVLNKDLKLKYSQILENSNINVIYNGLNLKDTIQSEKKEKVWDICYVGRLSPSKQIEHALFALKNSHIIKNMIIIGDGARKDKLLKLVNQLNISDRVHFTGWVDEPIEYIKKSKILVLPSQTEGFGLVIGEALLNGTHVVAYNCSEGVSHQFFTPDMQRGLVQPNNRAELKNSIEDILENPYQIPPNLSKRYDIKEMADKFIKLID